MGRLMVRFDGARCEGADPNLFYPTRGQTSTAAKAICDGDTLSGPCPAKAECLEFATFGTKPVMEHGVWAGTTGRQRQRLRKEAAA